MATHCQTATRSGSSERQDIQAVNSFEGNIGGWSTSNKETNRGSNLLCKMCLFSLYFVT